MNLLVRKRKRLNGFNSLEEALEYSLINTIWKSSGGGGAGGWCAIIYNSKPMLVNGKEIRFQYCTLNKYISATVDYHSIVKMYVTIFNFKRRRLLNMMRKRRKIDEVIA